MSAGPPRGAALETLRLRAAMLARMRAFFSARGVLEVETPALSAAAASDPALESLAAEAGRLGGTRYLHTSPELAMKRLLAGGAGDIYQICRVFRDGELGRWHQPEFTMVEWYRLGFDDERLMDEVEALARDALLAVSEVSGATGGSVSGATGGTVSGATGSSTGGSASGATGSSASGPADWPARRVRYRDAFTHAVGADPLTAPPAELEAALRARDIEPPAGLHDQALLDLAFATLVAPSFPDAEWTFVYDYPPNQAALARLKPQKPPVAARFELFAAGLELANGFDELTDAAEQRRRFEADQALRERLGKPIRPIDAAFLAALESGLPACAGVALGFDRLVAVAAGATSIAETIAFAHE